MTTNFCLFDTPIGICAVAWSDVGIRALSLPELTREAIRARMLRRDVQAVESEPTADAQSAIGEIIRLLSGERVDLSHTVLDESGVPAFNRQVYAITRKIAPGETRTYGAIARQLGDPQLAQQVGQVLGRNPIPIITPCHRVLGAKGKLTGFSAPGGTETKRKILLIERALPDEPLSLFPGV